MCVTAAAKDSADVCICGVIVLVEIPAKQQSTIAGGFKKEFDFINLSPLGLTHGGLTLPVCGSHYPLFNSARTTVNTVMFLLNL